MPTATAADLDELRAATVEHRDRACPPDRPERDRNAAWHYEHTRCAATIAVLDWIQSPSSTPAPISRDITDPSDSVVLRQEHARALDDEQAAQRNGENPVFPGVVAETLGYVLSPWQPAPIGR